MDQYEELIRTLKEECTALEQRCMAQDDMLQIQEKTDPGTGGLDPGSKEREP